MKIDYLSETTLKLTLTAEDMKDYELDYAELSQSSFKSRRRLCGLLRELCNEGALCTSSSFFLDDKRFFVEVFPRVDGGCLLYVSVLPDKDGRQGSFSSEPKATGCLICELEASEPLKKLCYELERERKRIDFSSALYSDGKSLRLVLVLHGALSKQLEASVSRFGRLIKGELDAAFTAEHFKTVIAHDAVYKISRFP